MKKEVVQVQCSSCGKMIKAKDILRFSWRYTDRYNTYLSSGRKIIHTGYCYLCPKCVGDRIYTKK